MFREDPSTHSTKLKERTLVHKRIADLVDLQKIYTLGEVLGKGNFGTVVKAIHKETKVNWAIKIINKRQAGASRVLLVEREIHILKLVNHPNIIYLDCVFESPKTIYLVFELCIGSLARIFKTKKRFEESEVVTVIRSLACALAYLHKNDIVHRDLKLENILIVAKPDDPDNKLYIKVTDFGLSAIRNGPGHNNMLHDCCGTLTYMAPEMIATKSYSQQCDVWSMGIIMYILLFGKFPFYSGNEQQLCKLIIKMSLDFSDLPCSPEARHLLTKLLEKNPAFRVTAAEVEHHPWILGTRMKLHAQSSNVLDMMRMWRDELLEPSGEDWVNADNSKVIQLNARPVVNDPLETISKLSLRSRTESSYPKQSLWLNPKTWVSSQVENQSTAKVSTVNAETREFVTADTEGQSTVEVSAVNNRSEKSVGSNDTDKSQSSTIKERMPLIKQCTERHRRRVSSRLPDFSNVTAKVDSNLKNLRKEAQRQRAFVRGHQSNARQ